MAAYALTIFTGAFLLFQVQPLIGKFILPWFGGGPGVWTTCMLFFQLLLVAGYAYAHFSTKFLRPRAQAILHLVLLVAALLLLPITPSSAWKPPPGADPTWRILLLLTATVGLPYFVLSTTGPLMQRWFSLACPGRSPYRLYALSNVGSLLALVSYPFVFEPQLTRQSQATFWSVGLFLFVLCAGFCARKIMRITDAPETATTSATPAATEATAPDWGVRLLWLFLPACASAFLLATTNKICQDVAVIPLLWVLPLALYLISFIISFDNPRWYWRSIFGVLYACSLLLVYDVVKEKHNFTMAKQIAAYNGVMFICCMVCHGELFRLRPHPRFLTAYYLMISLGGALGGIFVAIVAPHIFVDYYEFQFGLLACGIALIAVIAREAGKGLSPLVAWVSIGNLALLIITMGYVLEIEVTRARKDAVVGRRNFYGVLTVFEYYKEKEDSHYFVLQHGRITHGLQFTDGESRRWPTTYYTETSGVGLTMKHFPRQTNRRWGLVGLGTGTMATYGKPGDYLRIYEINPVVKELATSKFTYLKDSKAKIDIIMGDARLSMENEPSQQFDVLVLDAFSSDAIPVHLLTREAFDIYKRHLKPDGVIAVHISNRHLDLRPVVLNIADQCNMQNVIIDGADGEETDAGWWIYATTWVLVTNNKEFLNKTEIDSARSAEEIKGGPTRLWTDDYSALFQVWR